MSKLLINYISFSHLFEFTIAYFLLDKMYLKGKINYILIIFFLFFSTYIGKHISNLDTLILLIFYFILSLTNSKNVTHSLLIVDISYLVGTFINNLMRPIFLIIINYSSLIIQIFCLLFIIFITVSLIFIISWILRKLILPKINTTLKELYISYLLTFFLIAYQSYWLINNYSNNKIFFKWFVLTFYIIFIILMIFILQSFIYNEELKLETQKQKLEYDIMQKYAEEVKKQYLDIRKFRHDYINILSSIEYYLNNNKLEELKHFYKTNIKQTKSIFKSSMLRLEDIQKINSLEIKSILTTKLITAQERGIDVQIEVNDDIPAKLPVDSIVLIRILGILLDNAIEELVSLKDGKLLVGIFTLNEDIFIIIQNTVRKNMEPLSLLKKEGFSTKGDNRGLGLSNVDNLVHLEKFLLLETVITNDVFIQKIIIVNGGN